MNQEIKDLFKSSEGRYFEYGEAARLRSYAESMLGRVESIQAIERAESTIVADAVDAVGKRYAGGFTENGPMAMQLAQRDFAMVIRYAAASMLMADPNFIHDKLAIWYRTIIFAMVKPEMVVFGFKALVEACRRHLSAADTVALLPYLAIVVNELESHLKKEAA
jgi:phosphoglucomutase